MALEINDCFAGRIMGESKGDDAHSKHPTPNANLMNRREAHQELHLKVRLAAVSTSHIAGIFVSQN